MPNAAFACKRRFRAVPNTGGMSHRLIARAGCCAISALLVAGAAATSAAVAASRSSAAGILAARSGTREVPGIPPGPVDDALGTSVAVSGTVAMVGAPDVNNGAGAVYLYRRTGTLWHLAAVLTDPASRPGDDFGWSVAIAGDTALIGAPATTYFTSGPPGVVYVFAARERDGDCEPGSRHHIHRAATRSALPSRSQARGGVGSRGTARPATQTSTST